MSIALGILKDTKKHVMTGVSYMIPFAVLGGVTLALTVLFSGQAAVPTEGWLGSLATVGTAGLNLMVPVLSGFTAFSISDRKGIAPGFVSGMVASNIGAGFLGGLVSGLLTGIVLEYLNLIKLPKSMDSVKSIFIMPLVGGLIVCSVMLFLIGQPIAIAMTALTDWLNGLSGGSALLLAMVVGAMICTDMGGPINKVAYTFGVTMVGELGTNGLPSESAMLVMAAIGTAIAVPPIACGLSTLIFRSRYTKDEKDAGLAAIVMGCVGITEGAIPFAAASPLRTLPPLMVSGALSAAISMALGATNPAPWGGFIVAPVCGNPLGYCVAIAIGAVVGAVGMGLLRKKVDESAPTVEEDTDDMDLDIKIG